MTWFICIGRLAFDDEDSYWIGQAESQEAAARQLEDKLRTEDPDDPDDPEPRECYINYVFACETPPELVFVNL